MTTLVVKTKDDCVFKEILSMVMYANCHLHSTFSDGAYSPEELVEIGHKLGHSAMILTDHDTVRGTYFMQRAARKYGIKTLLGCEFSTIGPENSELHLLGFDFNTDNKLMAALLEKASSQSRSTVKYLLEMGLERKTLKEGVVWRDVVEAYPYHDYFSNGHIFSLYVQRGIYKPEEYPEFFVTSFKKTPERLVEIETALSLRRPSVDEVIKTIIAAEGVPVVAHLGATNYGKIEYADELYKMGAKGFETNHPENNTEARRYLEAFCNEHSLYKMGGTDHSAELGGCPVGMPEHDMPNDCGGVFEENFYKLYNRELG